MSFNVILPHGRSVDLAETAVIRSVDQAESDRHNVDVLDYLKGRPNFDGTVPDTRWSVAIERKGQRPIYSTGSVKSLVEAGLDQRFDLIDGGRSAIAKGAKVHLIRPLAEREGSTTRATIWVEGGSTNGLRTESDVATIKAELGARAGHLAPIGDEGFIDRARIARVSACLRITRRRQRCRRRDGETRAADINLPGPDATTGGRSFGDWLETR